MGLCCPENYGDPLILFPSIYKMKNKTTKGLIGIIPHYFDKDCKNLKKLIIELENKNYKLKIIDIETGNEYKKFLNEINNCEYIISSSLHGIIMGLVYKKKNFYNV